MCACTVFRNIHSTEILEKEMATYSITLAWKIPWTEKPDRLQSMGLQRVRQDWATSLSFSYSTERASPVAQLVKNPPAMQETWIQSLGREDPLKRERQPTPVFWPGEFHGLYNPWGCKGLDMSGQLSHSTENLIKNIY